MTPLTLPIGWQLKTKWNFWFESARMIETAFGFIHNNGVKGDYLEFGVFNGRTFVEAWYAAQRYSNMEMRFHAFDSFEGLPSISREDSAGEFRRGQFRCDREAFERNLGANHIDMARVSITEGSFESTLHPQNHGRTAIDNAAIVWIDCDLYASTVPVLNYLTNILVDGSVLIFDDWYCFKGKPDHGEQRACSEWLRDNPRIRLIEYQKFHWAGISFIVDVR
jgi:hypothetical protein